MLRNMHIKNIVLIDELDIDLESGLNILTGETGAGKSIIVEALGIGLGGRFSKELLRYPEETGLVELTFSVEKDSVKNGLLSLEITPEDGEILISRKLSGGRVINRINDETVTLGKIKAAAEILINLHAQHEQQTLLKASKHLEILDTFSDEILVQKNKTKEAYQAYANVREQLLNMQMDAGERTKRMDFLQFEIREIGEAHLRFGEDTELEEFYKKIKNAKDILSAAGEVYDITGYENNRSAGNEISHALQTLKKILNYDPAAEGMVSMLTDIDALTNDFNRELKEYISDMEFDPSVFEKTEERLNDINRLKAKYGRTIDEILAAKDGFEKEYEELCRYEETLRSLQRKEEKANEELIRESDILTELRKKHSVFLCEKIKEALKELNFSQVIFYMKFEDAKEYSANGHDEACFMISTNVGEAERPLYEVASGGELSRVMLAIKSCFADTEDTPTLVFDEVDVGISGITAQKVARMLQKIAAAHQVISITHLAQIAAMADVNYKIDKKVVNNKTVTEICKLDSEGAILEIARLLGGEHISEQVLSSAREMKGLADTEKLY